MTTFLNGNQQRHAFIQGKQAEKIYTNGQLVYSMARVDRVLTNIISNGSFEENTTGWGGSHTLSRQALTPDHGEYGSWVGQMAGTVNGAIYTQLSTALTTVSNRKYYIRAVVKNVTSGYANIIQFMNTATALTGFSTQSLTNNVWALYDGIWTANSTSLLLRLNFTGGNGNQTRTAQFDNIMVIDLTSVFGAGQEPIIEELREAISDNGGYWDGEKTIGF